MAFVRTLQSEGVLVAAGPLDGGATGEGMAVVRAADPAAAAELARRAQDEDLSVVRDVLHVRVRPWAVALMG